MPAMLSVGVDFKILPKLKASLGTHYYFDKTADYGHRIDLDLNSSTPSNSVTNSFIIDKNFYELGCGLEYNISDKILVSSGYLYAKTGVNTKYQSDLAYSLSSSTIGGGGAYKISDKLMINLGLGYTIYHNAGKMIGHFLSGTTINVPMYETYYKDNLLFAVGVDFSF
jgi:long-chain fatty acid transport protein